MKKKRNSSEKIPKEKPGSFNEPQEPEINVSEGESSSDPEIDEHFIDLSFVLGGSISKGIPWDSFSELEIHVLLKIHFEFLGYNVIWRHKDDPANERGVDLECTHKIDGTKIVVAVKKKPRKNALAQVVELSHVAADHRFYVFIGGATQSFRDNIGTFSNVQFLNEDALEDYLNKFGQTLRLKIDNSQANDAMFSIMRNILKFIETKPKKIGLPEPTVNMIETLWGMKDRSVTVHKCSSMLKLMFEDSKRVGELTHVQVQNLVVWCLDFLYVYGLQSLRNAFETLSPDLHALLFHVHEETKIRSNWFELYTYRPGLMPGTIFSAYKEHEKNKREWKTEEKLLDTIEEGSEKEPKIIRLELDNAVEKFRQLAVWADGLEGTIDYLFDYWVQSYKNTLFP